MRIKISIFFLIMVCLRSTAQAPIDDAIEIFNSRHQKANGLQADSSHINKCIAAL